MQERHGPAPSAPLGRTKAVPQQITIQTRRRCIATALRNGRRRFGIPFCRTTAFGTSVGAGQDQLRPGVHMTETKSHPQAGIRFPQA